MLLHHVSFLSDDFETCYTVVSCAYETNVSSQLAAEGRERALHERVADSRRGFADLRARARAAEASAAERAAALEVAEAASAEHERRLQARLAAAEQAVTSLQVTCLCSVLQHAQAL